jgi:hypothetical protein
MVLLAGGYLVCLEPFVATGAAPFIKLTAGLFFLSLVIGFVLSLLGSILLFLGHLWSFAGKSCAIYVPFSEADSRISPVCDGDDNSSYWHGFRHRGELSMKRN